MRNTPQPYKHDNPTYHSYGKSGDGKLLRKGYAKGGAVANKSGRKCVAEDGTVGDCASNNQAWIDQSNEAMSNPMVGPKTGAMFEAEAKDKAAISQGLSNYDD